MGENLHFQLLDDSISADRLVLDDWVSDPFADKTAIYSICWCLDWLWNFLCMALSSKLRSLNRWVFTDYKNYGFHISNCRQRDHWYLASFRSLRFPGHLSLLGFKSLLKRQLWDVHMLCGYEWRLSIRHLLWHFKLPIPLGHCLFHLLHILCHWVRSLWWSEIVRMVQNIFFIMIEHGFLGIKYARSYQWLHEKYKE